MVEGRSLVVDTKEGYIHNKITVFNVFVYVHVN